MSIVAWKLASALVTSELEEAAEDGSRLLALPRGEKSRLIILGCRRRARAGDVSRASRGRRCAAVRAAAAASHEQVSCCAQGGEESDWRRGRELQRHYVSQPLIRPRGPRPRPRTPVARTEKGGADDAGEAAERSKGGGEPYRLRGGRGRLHVPGVAQGRHVSLVAFGHAKMQTRVRPVRWRTATQSARAARG